LTVEVRAAAAHDRDDLVRMRRALWPDSVEEEVDALLETPEDEGLIAVASGTDGLVGFAEFGLRKYADGCDTSPVAYLEGIWVDADVRRAGVATDLVRAGEAWARSRGLLEMASDCELGNSGSEAFHLAARFDEVQRAICFRRRLSSMEQDGS
jgi:aminoglycoside 6'-N-acetyltransferase I